MGIVERFVGALLGSWLLIGLIVAIFTANIGMATFTTVQGLENTGLAVVLWPVPAGQGLCATGPNDTSGFQCNGFHFPGGNYKIVKTR